MGEDKVRKSIFKKWWFWLIVVLAIIIIAAASGGNKNQKNAQTPATGTQGKGNTAATTGGNQAAQSGQQITFKNILLDNALGTTMVYGEAYNNSDRASSFTVKVSFYDKSKKLLGTAAGAVNDLNGGSMKIFSALASADYSKADSYKVQVDTMISATANKQSPISFSNIVQNNAAGVGMIEGEAKNNDTATHSFTMTVGLYDSSGKLIGVAAGAVNDLAGGDTKTFSAMTTGKTDKVKSFKVFVDSMVK